MTRLALLCWKYWKSCLFTVALLTTLAVPRALKIQLDLSVESLYPASSQAVSEYEKVKQAFGSDAVAAVYVEDAALFSPARLKLLQSIHQQLLQLPFIVKVESLFSLPDVRDQGGMISTAPVLAKLPQTEAEAATARDRALNNPLLRHQLISKDGTAVLMLLRLSAKHQEISQEARAEALEKILNPHRDRFTQLFQVGDPFVQSWMKQQLATDQRLILPAALGIVLLLLVLTQRSFWAGVVPVLNAAFAIVWTAALMQLLGIPINFLNSILPALIVIIGATSDVHFIHEYREHLAQGMDADEAMKSALHRLALPLLLTCSTTVLGFATTALSDLPILRDFGTAATIGMSARFFISIVLLPSILRLLGRVIQAEQSHPIAEESLSGRIARGLVAFLHRQSKPVMALLLLLFGTALWQASHIQPGNDLSSFLRPESPVRVRDRIVSENLAGLTLLTLVLKADPGEFLEPRALKHLEALTTRLRTVEGVAAVTSFSDLLARMNAQLRGGDARFEQVPDEAASIRQMMLFLHPKDYQPWLSTDHSQAAIQIRCLSSTSTRLLELKQSLEKVIQENPSHANAYTLTGSALLIAQAAESITQGQVSSLGTMMLMVFLIVWGIFLSARCGFITLLVNLFPVAMIFGLMGASGITLNIGTCMVAAITLGIAVDDTLHLLVRFNREARERKNERLGIEAAIREELAPISITTIALAAGFGMLTLSSFQPVREFGLLSAGVMALGLITDMIVTPVMFGRTRIVTLWDILGLKVRQSLIEKSPFFAGLSAWQARRVILASNVVEHEAGDIPVKAGDIGSSLYVVLSGELQASLHTPQGRKVLKEMQPGDVFGEMAFVTRQRRTADVTALSATKLLKLNYDELSRLRRFSPYLASQLLFNISRIVCERAVTSAHSPNLNLGKIAEPKT